MRKNATENILLENNAMDTPGNVFKFDARKPL